MNLLGRNRIHETMTNTTFKRWKATHKCKEQNSNDKNENDSKKIEKLVEKILKLLVGFSRVLLSI